jgi:H+/gluconate symporter-like permease
MGGMDQRWLAGGAAAIGAFAVPGPGRLAALGWLGERPSFLMLLILAIVAFTVIVGFALLAWKLLTRDWPPREAIGLLAIVVAARLTLDVVRLMGLWII